MLVFAQSKGAAMHTPPFVTMTMVALICTGCGGAVGSCTRAAVKVGGATEMKVGSGAAGREAATVVDDTAQAATRAHPQNAAQVERESGKRSTDAKPSPYGQWKPLDPGRPTISQYPTGSDWAHHMAKDVGKGLKEVAKEAAENVAQDLLSGNDSNRSPKHEDQARK